MCYTGFQSSLLAIGCDVCLGTGIDEVLWWHWIGSFGGIECIQAIAWMFWFEIAPNCVSTKSCIYDSDGSLLKGIFYWNIMVWATINAYLSDIFVFVSKCPNWWHKDRRYDAPTMLISAILYLKIYLCPKGSIKKILHNSQTHRADVAYLRNVTARYTPKM